MLSRDTNVKARTFRVSIATFQFIGAGLGATVSLAGSLPFDQDIVFATRRAFAQRTADEFK